VIIVRWLSIAFGILCILSGLLWMGQGTGVIHWPASSFMIAQTPWIARGAVMALFGVVVILLARRIRR